VQISLTGAPSTAVMTTNIAQFMLALAEVTEGDQRASAARRRVIVLLPVIVGFAIGCALGATGEVFYGLKSLALPVGLALLTVTLSRRPGSRSATRPTGLPS
jgi:uncharacterized membrane protein YoaK (UPF0700 family)